MADRALVGLLTVATSADGLARTAASLLAQRDSGWQWCVLVPGDGEVYAAVSELAADDPRIVVGLGSAAQSADLLGSVLAMADADLVALLPPGGALDAGAVGALREAGADGWIYTDEAAVYADGSGIITWFKPPFAPELLRSQPYPVGAAFLPLDTVRELGGPNPAFGGAQWYDLVLRVWESLGDPEHVTGPYVLRPAEQNPLPPPWLDGSDDDRCRVVGAHCDRVGIAIEGVDPVRARGRALGQRVRRRVDRWPSVSIAIPTRGGSSVINGLPRVHIVELVRSIWVPGRYPDLELIVSYDSDTPEDVLESLREITGGHVVLQPFRGPFHFSRKCNEAALAAGGELICFLNDDMQVRNPDWLQAMVPLLNDPDVGAVGGKLYFADGTLQHAGHVYNGGSAGHLLFGAAADTVDSAGLAQLTGERAGVTGACLLMRRDEFVALGGFSEEFPLNFNDVDLCLKIRDEGQRILYTPAAELDHFESQTRESKVLPSEIKALERRWRVVMHSDPIMNPLERLPLLPRPDVLQF